MKASQQHFMWSSPGARHVVIVLVHTLMTAWGFLSKSSHIIHNSFHLSTISSESSPLGVLLASSPFFLQSALVSMTVSVQVVPNILQSGLNVSSLVSLDTSLIRFPSWVFETMLALCCVVLFLLTPVLDTWKSYENFIYVFPTLWT